MASRSARRSSAAAAQTPRSKMAVSRSSSPASGAEAVEVARKRRHRELVKRSYYQKLELLKELRQQERSLATQHSALLRYVQARPPVTTASGPSTSAMVLHDQYVQATSEKERQAKENATLHRIHAQHVAFQKKLAAASVAEEEACRTLEEPSKEPADSVGEKQSLHMKPMTAEASYEVIRTAYAEVCSYRTSRDLYTSTAQVLGWSHRYRLEGEKLQYSICKFFPGITAQELSNRGWVVMTTESSYKALHSQGMTSNLHDVQTVNKDNRVFCRELQRPGQKALMKTLLLASRFQTDVGYMTIYRALDHEKLGFTGVGGPSIKSDRTPKPRVVWLDMFAWTSFEDRGDDSGVEFQFGGEMKHFCADNAKFWMMEVLLMALRWESRTVGPLLTLHG